MRTVTVSHNWYSFPRCSGIAVLTVFGAPSDVSCRDQGRACRAWSGLVGMEAELGHSLTVWSSCSLTRGFSHLQWFGFCSATAMDVCHFCGWYPESTQSLIRWNISSWRVVQAHLQALPMRPDMPGAFICTVMNIASFTSLFVTLVYCQGTCQLQLCSDYSLFEQYVETSIQN